MKKLMIAACAIALAGVVQAASYTWSSTGTVYTYDSADPDWPTVAAGTTAYFVFASAYSQADLVSDFSGNSVNYTKLSALGNGTINADGGVNATAATGDYTSNQTAYFVVFQDAEHMFVSDTTTAAYNALTAANVAFDSAQVDDVWSDTPFQASAGYQGGGWYAVPEPTSGLLMLLGMAGLALRRKRA